MATKEITFPKRQNVTFYEKDKDLYYQIAELAKKDGRPVQNYILQLLHQVIPTKLENSTLIKDQVEEVIEEKETNNKSLEETRNFLAGLGAKK